MRSSRWMIAASTRDRVPVRFRQPASKVRSRRTGTAARRPSSSRLGGSGRARSVAALHCRRREGPPRARRRCGGADTSDQTAIKRLTTRMRIEITRWDVDELIGTMPVKGNRQSSGVLHGGANAVLAESLGALAAALHAEATGRAAPCPDLSCSYHRTVADGVLTGICRPVHLGETTSSLEIVISEDESRCVCTARLTFVLRAHGTSRRGTVLSPVDLLARQSLTGTSRVTWPFGRGAPPGSGTADAGRPRGVAGPVDRPPCPSRGAGCRRSRAPDV
ncbi:hotdog fold thioesterase [Lentzea sp. NPDC059081]|uniref:hotdog fold thioesterase n=1 Tax=Lentzea sp. NPDC059081 TaxID=3346719 RepID=UPI0036973761